MNIVLLESLGIPEPVLAQYADSLKKRGHSFRVYEKTDNLEKLKEELQDADVAILANMPLPWDSIKDLPRLRYIDVAFTGTDHIPVAQAAEKGIQVSNASGYADDSVAELCIGLMIDLLRSIPQAERACRTGGTKTGLPARLLKGKTIGFVGAGRIAGKTAALAKAFGAETTGFRRHPIDDPAFDRQAGSLEELLQQSDIVSIHTPLTDSTRNLISEKELSQMKASAFLINTARGPVVDAAALEQALKKGTIAGAAVDVFDKEPPLDPAGELLAAPNLIVTPHIGFYTEESMLDRARIVFDNLDQWLEGTPKNLVAPQ